MVRLKNILAFFSLIVFLLPLVESEIHSYAHMDDFHCSDNTTVHFHKAFHHCKLCDFTVEFSTSPGLYPPKLPVLTTGDTYFNFSQNIYFLQPKDFHSLRAPPSLA